MFINEIMIIGPLLFSAACIVDNKSESLIMIDELISNIS